ncbi:hypothetical protein [Knoellia remsis]|uniref:hypothetical protein n=1 Tax=Knoellia remsis TaxID=407159 RepID=UPI000D04B338|nr:hypothetical protein [Knoellia remsis]
MDAAELGAVIRSGLAHSEQDYQAPVITRDRTGSPVAQALGLASFDAMIRAGALAVTVFRRNEWLKVESTTTDRTAFAVQPSNWTTTLPADSDVTTVGEAVLKARSHSTVDFSR